MCNLHATYVLHVLRSLLFSPLPFASLDSMWRSNCNVLFAAIGLTAVLVGIALFVGDRDPAYYLTPAPESVGLGELFLPVLLNCLLTCVTGD